MARKRKPTARPLADAAEALLWRARILTEILEGLSLPVQTAEPIGRLKEAMADYEFSKSAGANGAPAHHDRLELQP